MSIGEILKALRKDNNLTQQELAERLKIGQATIACYENGQREPSVSNLISYADFFECTLDFITGRTDDMGNVVIDEKKSSKGADKLTDAEIRLLKNYRALDGGDKIRLAGYIDGLKDK